MRIKKATKTIKASNETGSSNIPTYKLAWQILKVKDWEEAGFSCEEEFEAMKKEAQEILRKTNGLPVKFSTDIKSSAKEQALTHIRAAIDILGKSGMKDEVTKDSIANLGIVMLDIKASTEDSAEVKITKEKDNWQIGTVSLPNSDSKVTFEAKVYDSPSKFGINNGRISKLFIKIDGKEVCNYERGWDKKPSTADAKTAYKDILEKFA